MTGTRDSPEVMWDAGDVDPSLLRRELHGDGLCRSPVRSQHKSIAPNRSRWSVAQTSDCPSTAQRDRPIARVTTNITVVHCWWKSCTSGRWTNTEHLPPHTFPWRWRREECSWTSVRSDTADGWGSRSVDEARRSISWWIRPPRIQTSDGVCRSVRSLGWRCGRTVHRAEPSRQPVNTTNIIQLDCGNLMLLRNSPPHQLDAPKSAPPAVGTVPTTSRPALESVIVVNF